MSSGQQIKKGSEKHAWQYYPKHSDGRFCLRFFAASDSIVREKGNFSNDLLLTFVIIEHLVDLVHIKSFQARKLIDSEPVVVIKNGKIVSQNLRKVRLTIDELNMQLRHKNVFNITDVEFAVMETDGKVSVLPKSQKQLVTPSDLNIPTTCKGLMKDIIIDGRVMHENLKLPGLMSIG